MVRQYFGFSKLNRLRPLAVFIAMAFPACASWAQVSGGQSAVEGGTLPTIIVSASGFEQEIRDAPASISVITREEIETRRATSIAEILSTVEGIDVGNSVGKTGGMNISMRGMPSEYTLILIDGRRQNVAGNITPNGFGETSTSFLPPVQAIDRIEVIRGPMSTLYGSDAMGGVINIITRKVSPVWTGSIAINRTFQGNQEFGDNYGGNFHVSGPLKEDLLGISVRGSLYHRDASDLEPTGTHGASTSISKRGPSPVQSAIRTGGFRLSLTPTPDHDLWLDVDAARQIYNNDNAQLGTLGVRGYEDTLRFNRDQYVLAHNWRLGFGQLESSITYNQTETIGRTIPSGTPNKVAGSSRTLEARDTIFDTKLVAGIGESHIASIGGQYWRARMIDGVAPQAYRHTQWAIFGEDEWRILSNLALTVGLRYDHHSQFGSHTSPRAYLVWNVTDRWTLKGGVSEGFKTPSLDQITEGITGFGGQGTIPLIGSPNLKPETSRSFEIGTLYDNQNGFRAGATVFYNRFEDKIASGDGLENCTYALAPNRPGCVNYGNWPNVDRFSQRINVDEAVTKGVELNLRVPVTSAINATANYTYTRSEQRSGANMGRPLYNTPKHMFNAAVTWDVTPQLSTWLRFEYRSERWRSDNAARAQLGNYKAYTLFHLGGSYEVSNNFTLSATIYNLFDKDFLEYGQYTNSSGATTYTGLYNNMNEGRRLWISGIYRF